MASQHIVVVNDNALYRALLKELFVDAGYLQVHCIQGSGAFDLVCQEQPSLVLLDMHMIHPGESWETLDLLRLHPATAHIPIILCAADPFMLRAKAAWVAELRCDILETPFDLDALLAKVRAVLGPPHQINAASV